MFGEAARGLKFSLGEDFRGMLLAILPPGAFIGLGFLIAIKNLIDKRLARRQTARVTKPLEESAQAGAA